MGSRFEDQPAEHWAGPESLDPTPVWKQFLVVGLLALGTLAIIAVVSLFALAPLLVTPPAQAAGGRVVLSRAQAQDDGRGAPVRVVVGPGGVQIGGPRLPEGEAIWVFRVGRDAFVALDGRWRDPNTGSTCPVDPTPGWTRAVADPAVPAFAAVGACAERGLTFGARGEPLGATRGLDRYLVSVDGERVIVNVSRPIRGAGRTPQPTRPAR